MNCIETHQNYCLYWVHILPKLVILCLKMSTVNWSWSWSAYYGSYTFFFGHHLCILFNNIQKLSVPVQRLQNEQQYSVVSVKSSGWCQWQFEPRLCKASMLLTNKRVKVSVWHYASTLGRYPQALKSCLPMLVTFVVAAVVGGSSCGGISSAWEGHMVVPGLWERSCKWTILCKYHW